MTSKLIAREKECQQLQWCIESDRSELVIVNGRRRIGKTFLIEQFFNKTYAFKYVGGHGLSTRNQLANFAKALRKYSNTQYKPFEDWFEAFDALEEYLESITITEGKKVIFIDEMPWIDTQRSDFVSALENFWNGWAMSQENIMLIATGSATSWMVDKIVQNQGGLHARITASIFLSPFSLKETEEYLKSRRINWDRYQILQCYMLLGGVPFYLSLLNRQESFAQNIDRLCFDSKGMLRMEFDELYYSIFPNADLYTSVVKLLSEHKSGMTRDEISKAINLEGGKLTRVLKNLEQCDFIAKWSQYGNKKKEAVYRLVDFYTLFYYRFIDTDNDRDSGLWTHNLKTPAMQSWMGLTFELICLQHHKQIKKALGISGMSTSISTWRTDGDKENGIPGGQIDMVIERADRMINLCEIKFSTVQFRITESYADKIRQRMALFLDTTNTKMTPVNTFITTYGVLNGKYSSVVDSEVTMDDLFNS